MSQEGSALLLSLPSAAQRSMPIPKRAFIKVQPLIASRVRLRSFRVASAECPSRNFLRKSRLETQVRAYLPIPQKGRVKEEPWQSTAGASLALRWLSQNGRIQLKNRRAWL